MARYYAFDRVNGLAQGELTQQADAPPMAANSGFPVTGLHDFGF